MTRSDTIAALDTAAPDAAAGLAEAYLARHAADRASLRALVTAQSADLTDADEISAGPVLAAISLLGELRDPEAAGLLAGLIHLRHGAIPMTSREDIPHWAYFPAAVALSKIGAPATGPLLDQLQVAPLGSLRFQLAAVTLEAIHGAALCEALLGFHAERFSEPARHGAAMGLFTKGHRTWSTEPTSP